MKLSLGKCSSRNTQLVARIAESRSQAFCLFTSVFSLYNGVVLKIGGYCFKIGVVKVSNIKA